MIHTGSGFSCTCQYGHNSSTSVNYWLVISSSHVCPLCCIVLHYPSIIDPPETPHALFLTQLYLREFIYPSLLHHTNQYNESTNFQYTEKQFQTPSVLAHYC